MKNLIVMTLLIYPLTGYSQIGKYYGSGQNLGTMGAFDEKHFLELKEDGKFNSFLHLEFDSGNSCKTISGHWTIKADTIFLTNGHKYFFYITRNDSLITPTSTALKTKYMDENQILVFGQWTFIDYLGRQSQKFQIVPCEK